MQSTRAVMWLAVMLATPAQVGAADAGGEGGDAAGAGGSPSTGTPEQEGREADSAEAAESEPAEPVIAEPRKAEAGSADPAVVDPDADDAATPEPADGGTPGVDAPDGGPDAATEPAPGAETGTAAGGGPDTTGTGRAPGTATAEGDADAARSTSDKITVTGKRAQTGAAALNTERKETPAVAEILGAEQMKRAGDTSASSALKRVTGLSIVGGRFLYVRGLGERYSATQLDGVLLPSPEPEQRAVPLDLFPSALLGSIVVQKSYTPDMPGEFGGGITRLRTKDLPDGPVGGVSISGRYRFGTTFRLGPRGEDRGPSDFLGIDGGYRALPADVADASDAEALDESDLFSDRGYDAAELEQFGESMPNRWAIADRVTPPDLSLRGDVGGGTKIPGARVGALAAFAYGSQWDREEVRRTYYLLGADSRLEAGNVYDFDGLTHTVDFGALGKAGIEAQDGSHAVHALLLLVRRTDDEARIYRGMNRDVGVEIEVSRLRFVERMLVAPIVRGEHTLGRAGIGFDWRYAGTLATRREPDRREIRYDATEPGAETMYLSDRPEGNSRVFSTLRDTVHDVTAALRIPLRLPGGRGQIAIGGAGMRRDRGVDTRRYKFMHKGEKSRGDTLLNAPEDVFTPATIGPDGFQFEETTRATDNYVATQDIAAGYVFAQLPLHPRVQIDAGLRLEWSRQRVRTFALFQADDVPVDAQIATLAPLPVVSATFTLREAMQLRAGYARTVSRPEFRELSEASWNDVTGGRETFGNPRLRDAAIHHVDVRWEWFPEPQDVLSASVFWKHIERPIETSVVVSAAHSVTWANATAADNVGVELEWRKGLGFVTPRLTNFYVAGNVAFIDSRVDLEDAPGIQTSTRRPLQGQSPWLMNIEAGYANERSGTNVAILWNALGARIEEVGALGAPDTWERERGTLDLVASQRLPGNFTLGVALKNVLNLPVRKTIGDEETERSRDGWTAGLSLGWTAPTK